MSDKTSEDKLTDAVNADDDLFMKLDETIRNHAESLGLNPDDFEFSVNVKRSSELTTEAERDEAFERSTER